MKSLFRCHFLINVVDKVVVGHSMWRGEAYLSEASSHHLCPPHGPFSSPWAFMRLSCIHSHPRVGKVVGVNILLKWDYARYFVF